MASRPEWLAIGPVLLLSTAANAQYPILDMVAGKVAQKYQGSTSEK
ncbi:hypothetical protein [Paraburkholderia haematera]|uniref:Uncharacterized protein n=1 Tax=Paraburkholderia haematera TaxID=2793077 RepID=A0ABM8SLF4_9BURK|nr:hypothetical protein [Paraburkholderia haematera]CAE6818279.1 hypothetical protein R69888_05982 [Paraburkholderia haematera]